MSDSSANNNQNESTNNQSQNAEVDTAFQRISTHMKGNKIEASLWITRMCSIFFSFMYMLPVGGGAENYKRALMANAATCALRLHQRLPPFQLNLAFASSIFLEDSAHYLMYSMIFLYNTPLTMAMLPVFMFSILHASSYSKQILNQIAPDSVPVLRSLIAKLESFSTTILRLVAVNEIFMMPAIIASVFTGRVGIIMVVFYYRFLCLRYNSRRNPYCRQIFYEIRQSVEEIAAKPFIPQIVRTIIVKSIALVNKLCPAAV